MMNYIYNIADQFNIRGRIAEIVPWGNGLINDTYRIRTDADEYYLLQRINNQVCPDVDGLMENIVFVTETINRREFFLRDGRKKQSMRVIRTKDARNYYRDPSGKCFRVYNFLMDSYSIEVANDSFEAMKAGVLLGQFHYLLRDFPVEELNVVMPKFHDPAENYRRLLAAVEKHRAAADIYAGAADGTAIGHDISEELAFFAAHEDIYSCLTEAHERGELPLRVNHNDAKINNIMFDRKMSEPICMVDLDTVMPGLLPYDFGDAIRSCMCTGKDKPEYAGVPISSLSVLDRGLYHSYKKGFLEGAGDMLTEKELEYLPMGAVLIAVENAMRYLKDYLEGNVYFKVKYPAQNLVKTRMHIRLAEELMQEK